MSWSTQDVQLLLKQLRRISAGQYVKAAVSAIGLVIAFKRIAPVPTVYHRGEVNNDLVPDEFKYPKLEVRFGNVGLGPMFIHSMQLVDENDNVIDPKTILPENAKAKVTSCCSFFGVMEVPKTWQMSGRVPIIVMRPKDTNDKRSEAWYNDTITHLKEKKLSLKVQYSWTKTPWFFFVSEDTIPLMAGGKK